MSVKCQVNVKSQSELDIGGCETCLSFIFVGHKVFNFLGSGGEKLIENSERPLLDEQKSGLNIIYSQNNFPLIYYD